MFEPSEIVNLVSGIGFYIYFIRLTQQGKCNQMPIEWNWGILFLVASNVFTVAEGFMFPVLLNYIEHFSSLIASLFFLVGAFNLKYSDLTE